MAELVVEPGTSVEVDPPGNAVEVESPSWAFETTTPGWEFTTTSPTTSAGVATPPTGVDVLLVPGPQGPQGVVGPQGPAFDAGGAYTHLQEVPSTVWDADHGLGFIPAGIRVRDVNGDTWFPIDITHPQPGQITRLTFPESVAGTAWLS